jgi:hypothetical protein
MKRHKYPIRRPQSPLPLPVMNFRGDNEAPGIDQLRAKGDKAERHFRSMRNAVVTQNVDDDILPLPTMNFSM